ncbi:MAG: cellulase family glycosylhydrolase [Thermoflexaceae bacterium]|nr:cellulase family glycosylhydrolase [Thermoflexaceae bacterium]
MKNKWKVIAVAETIVIAVVLVFIIGFLMGRMGKTDKTTKNAEVAVTESINETKKDMPAKQTDAAPDSQTEESTQTDAVKEKETFEVKEANGNLKLSFELVQQWGDETKYYYNYSVVVENTGDEPTEEWAVKVPVSEDFELSSYWNAECVVEDGYLYVTPVDFNRVVKPGEKTDSVGIIIACKGEASFEGAVIGTKAGDTGTSGTEKSETKQSGQNQSKQSQTGGNAVTTYQGKLSVNGTNLVDKDNNVVQLRGISTHGIAWYPEYVNYDSFKTLRDEFGANVIRLAMYTGEGGGYCAGGNQEELKKLIDEGVKYATDLSMYVIIDWHILSDNNPNTNKDAAKVFFEEMSKKYGDYDNVFYEICNEPNGGTTWEDVKKYAEEIIPVIRKNDKDGIILVGTPTWSQDVDKALENPITGYDNIMYVLHFYAATHKDDLRNKMTKAIDGGLPVFISEFSICDASGNGGIDYDSASKWLDVINQYHISYVGWNLSNKNESSAILKPSCTKTSGYTVDDLSDTGKWLVETFQ